MASGFLKKLNDTAQSSDSKIKSQAWFVHHDQLNAGFFPELVTAKETALIFVESKSWFGNIPYHKKRIIYQLSCQRHFALECAEEGFQVIYLRGDEPVDEQLRTWLKKDENRDTEVGYMQPADWDMREAFFDLSADFNGRVSESPNTFFMSDPEEWKEKIADGYLMEFFYREMRKRTGYLMNGKNPEGGSWNYDKENRKKLPKSKNPPEPVSFSPDDITQEVSEWVEEHFPNHFGQLEDFDYAVNREQALKAADDFFENRFDDFGPYEDAMALGERLVYHSGLSLYMNNGLLSAEELCLKALEAYDAGKAPLNSVEGYIRQIIGWREYIRNYYEALMPEIRDANVFGFNKPVPQAYWDGKSDMKCISECVKPVVETGYSHHIPRLMVLSNFSNLTETDPRELFKWFWYAFVDAWEWVVLPNVLGMSTFADGGILASKPYASSGNYINKMSDYCKSCTYTVSRKTGEGACPLNYLYWNFVSNQRDAFEANGRVSAMMNMYDKKSDEEKQEIREQSEAFIANVKRYEV